MLMATLMLSLSSCFVNAAKEVKYLEAIELIESGDYKAAYEIFLFLGDYKDCEAYASRPYSRFSLVIYFIYNIKLCRYQSQSPNSSHFSFALFVSIHLFSPSVSPFLLCR